MSQGLRMVHLRTVSDSWHAKVLAARLGAEGIVTHLQGNVSGPYPFGAVSVLVEEGQAELAAELLLADEVESAFTESQRCSVGAGPAVYSGGAEDDILAYGDDPDHPHGRHLVSRRRRAAAAMAAVFLAGAPVLAHFIG